MGRIVESIFGHGEVLSSLLRVVKGGRLPSTLLFSGPEGVGKKKVAYALAQVLLCEKGEGCGQCSSCLRVEKQESEALLLLSPEKEGSFIKVEQSRQVLDFIRLKMDVGTSRVVIIDGADRLNPHAANLLLKTLEEPPQRTYFVLIASSLAGVLSTIRSRSQILRFPILSSEDLHQFVKSQGWQNLPVSLISASGGSPGKLQAMVEGAWAEVRQGAMNFMSGAFNGDYNQFHQLKEQVKDKEVALLTCRSLQTLLRDGLWAKTHQEGWVNGDCDQVVHYLAQMKAENLLKMADGAKQVEEGILAHFDRALLFENLWYLYREQCQVT